MEVGLITFVRARATDLSKADIHLTHMAATHRTELQRGLLGDVKPIKLHLLAGKEAFFISPYKPVQILDVAQ